ncbi:MAG: hypothetical protein KTR31_11385 [Myxococcales bacterium]|nr:hypothetical protein [Myxococcales bacterium]
MQDAYRPRGWHRASPLQRVLAVALAGLLPAAIVVGLLVGMERFRTFDDARADRNAGRIINGRVIKTDVREYIENALRRHEPEVVVLGNSLSNTDVMGGMLAKRLGLPKNKVQKFSVPNSIGTHWYAILRNRIYAGGHRPRLVLIPSDMQSLLATTPRSEASYLNLSIHLDEEEPEIDARLGRRSWFLERVRSNRGHVRDRSLTWLRNRVVDLLFHRSLVRTDGRVTEATMARVFDDDEIDMRLHNRVIPTFVQSGTSELIPFDPRSLPEPEDSFLPVIAKLVADHGGIAVFVRPPMSPFLPDGLGDVVLEDAEARVPTVSAEHGGLYLDVRDLDMEHGHFQNVDHMRPEGARRFTEVLADTLVEVDAWEVAESEQAIDLLRPTEVVDNVLRNVEPSVTFRTPPPAVPRSHRKINRGPGRMPYFAAEQLAFMSDLTTLAVTRHASRCSPIRVLENGVPLPMPNRTCEETSRHRRGRMCHSDARVYFTSTDDLGPWRNGRRYSLGLDPDRACDGARWLYPGDRLRIRVPDADFASLDAGAASLVLSVRDMSVRDEADTTLPRVRARARVGQAVRMDAWLDVPPDPGTGHRLPIEPRIEPGTTGVAVDVINKSDRFLLLTGARLHAR